VWWIFQISAAVGQPLDDVEHPQRPGAVVGILVDGGDEVEQRPLVTGRRQGDPADVVAEVELRVGAPHRRAEPPEAGHDPLAEPGHGGHRGGELAGEVLDVGRAVEEDEGTAAGVQPRILLDVPHQRLGVRHPSFEALLAGCAGSGGFGHGASSRC
jgi:hypothetical protein